jgi:hypothetical protein
MVVRVTEPGHPTFQLRKDEEGLSVFDPLAVTPSLTTVEILESFRPGSFVIVRSREEIAAKGLNVVPVLGGEPLPPRLRNAHAEIRPRAGMTRAEFKQALKELE